ncbi:MAG: TetR/AcrR family transcriptional regulator [Frankiales bacterium]|nr:TetR/AcrR family transcriptional regulator [Frankiales bacterium]
MVDVSTAKIDRRQRKSRAALHAALVQLIADRPYGEITVEDIVTAADVARATFYAHYRDKDDLLSSANVQLMNDLTAVVAGNSWQDPPAYTGSGIAAILRHVDAHPALYRLLITGEGGAGARGTLLAAFTDTAAAVFTTGVERMNKTPRQPMTVITAAFVGALVHVIERWLSGDLSGSVDEIAAAFMQGQARGLEWSLGFEYGDMQYVAGDTASSA